MNRNSNEYYYHEGPQGSEPIKIRINRNNIDPLAGKPAQVRITNRHDVSWFNVTYIGDRRIFNNCNTRSIVNRRIYGG